MRFAKEKTENIYRFANETEKGIQEKLNDPDPDSGT